MLLLCRPLANPKLRPLISPNASRTQAIAALAYGAGPGIEPCDAVVGPGNMFVTAAKSLVAGRVAIDMLAGFTTVLL